MISPTLLYLNRLSKGEEQKVFSDL